METLNQLRVNLNDKVLLGKKNEQTVLTSYYHKTIHIDEIVVYDHQCIRNVIYNHVCQFQFEVDS